jgi:BirA family biotin operon repressor/biotin-[acetyl-CoA-carboxylase] ligase
MEALIIGKDIELVAAVDSTNEYAKRSMRSVLDFRGYWVFTDRQNKGKGQAGNAWISVSGKSFTGSFVVQPQSWPGREQAWAVRAQRLFAVCVQHSLRRFLALEIDLKWPNDVYVGGKKAGGMLIELGWQQGVAAWTVAGLGLNLSDFPELPADAAHLDAQMPPLDFLREWGAVFQDCWVEYRFWDDERLLHEYLKGLWGLHEKRWFQDCLSGLVFEGAALGVDAENRLLVRPYSESKSSPIAYDIKSIKWLSEVDANRQSILQGLQTKG